MSAAAVDTPEKLPLWADMEAAFARFLDACAAGKVAPLLEADVAGYLYYLLVSDRAGDANRIHLSTRLAGTDGKEKDDLVVGDVLDTDTLKRLFIERTGSQLDERMGRLLLSRSVRSGFRPAVRGELVVEFKHFARGFDRQQLRVHADRRCAQAASIGKAVSGEAGHCPLRRGKVPPQPLARGDRRGTEHRRFEIALVPIRAR